MTAVDHIKVRMYRHGFGDCFLLQFYAGTERTGCMLIDCGLKKNDSVPGIKMSDVVDDIKTVLKLNDKSKKRPKLDFLVVTHEHWDHVSGFHPKEKLFDGIDFGKVWMAWTEDPEDEEAKVINATLTKRIKAIKLAQEKMKKSKSSKPAFYNNFQYGGQLYKQRQGFESALNDVMGFYGALGATKVSSSGIRYKDKYKISIETQNAIDHVRVLARKTAGIKYFKPGKVVEDDTKFPGVRVYVMGPPKSASLNKDTPSAGSKKEVYFSMGESSALGFVNGLLHMGDGDADVQDDGRPFNDAPSLSIKEGKVNMYLSRYFKRDQDWRTIEDDWLDIAGALALQMDSDTNNTSLVLAFELAASKKVLLFPGDAQVGNWLSWHDHKWEVRTGSGKVEVTAVDLLRNTVLYKVGHHASHNATLKEKGLALMGEDLVALVPEKEKQYNGIPYGPLMSELKKKTRGRTVVSADKNHKAEDVLKNKPDELSAGEWKDFNDNIEITPLYVEYTVRG